MTTRRPIKDDLEYNDGLGDMLREREREEFSWVKTSFSAVSIVIVVLIVFIVGFQFAKFTLARKAAKSHLIAKPSTVPVTREEIDSEIAKIEEQNNSITGNIATSATESVSMDGIPTATSEPPLSAAKPVVAVAPKPTLPKPMSPPKPAVVTPVKPNTAVVAPTSVPAAVSRDFKVIAGSYATRETAQAQAIELAKARIPSFIWVSDTGGRPIYRVQVGAYPTQAQAEASVAEFSRKGISAVVVKK